MRENAICARMSRWILYCHSLLAPRGLTTSDAAHPNPVWSENSMRSYRRPFSGLSVGCGIRQCAAGPAFLTQEYAIGPVHFGYFGASRGNWRAQCLWCIRADVSTLTGELVLQSQ